MSVEGAVVRCGTPQRKLLRNNLTKTTHLGGTSTCCCSTVTVTLSVTPPSETPPFVPALSFCNGATSSSKLSTSSISPLSKSLVVTSGSLAFFFRLFFRLLLLWFKIEAGQCLSLLAPFSSSIPLRSGSFRMIWQMTTVDTAMMTRTVVRVPSKVRRE